MLLPICTSVATILGPLIASLTVEAKPQAQGDDQSLLKRYPYALPALMNSTLLLVSLVATFLFLEEVSKIKLLMRGDSYSSELTGKDLGAFARKIRCRGCILQKSCFVGNWLLYTPASAVRGHPS